jgi:hypothetical protein
MLRSANELPIEAKLKTAKASGKHTKLLTARADPMFV